MSFKSNLIKARSHIAFVLGLLLAAAFALSVESRVNVDAFRSGAGVLIEPSDQQLPLAAKRPLTSEELEFAKIAWRYFENNFQPETGLVNSVNNFPSTTVWDQASYLLGLISAEQIGIVDSATFDSRMKQALETLSRLPLFDERLPNKVYDTRSLAMVDYTNTPIDLGIGWSALDVARMAVPLNVLLYDYPQHSAQASQILSNWDFAAMLADGVLMGSRIGETTGAVEIIQEGRLGYEEYGARAVALLGMDAMTAARYDDFLDFESIGGQQIAVDSRSVTEFDAHTYVVSEPFILMAVEFGFDTQARELAQRVYLAQLNRYQTSGQLTAVSEDNIDQAPYFIYNSVYADGVAWNPLAEDGTIHEDKRTVSTKAAFGWDVIFDTDYTDRLMRHVGPTKSKDGFHSGLYESDGRVNAVATAN
ncbi:hypothetical protein AB838_01985, partial [Rhodobacteraceae bacterium (ex Bugula neritina AB1)]